MFDGAVQMGRLDGASRIRRPGRAARAARAREADFERGARGTPDGAGPARLCALRKSAKIR
ncbi:hypothetical protein WK18_13060 [Burkholderia ubonensis]|nr:hypothetical protein WK18_13060 [Burkholderia ubonensis]